MSHILDVPQSGKVGTYVTYATRFGLIRRQYIIPRDPKSPPQMAIRANLGLVSARWRTLTEEQRLAWIARGRDAKTLSCLGRTTYLTGIQLYNRINCARLAVGLEIFDDPPDLPQFGENPVAALAITNSRGAVSLKLSLRSAPAEHTLVMGAAYCSAGRSSVRHFVFLGFLPAPVRGVSEINDLYVERFGVPPVGTKVFICTQQHLDGWTDLPIQISAIVQKA